VDLATSLPPLTFAERNLITLKLATAWLLAHQCCHRSALLKGNERRGFARGSLAVWLGDFYDLKGSA
jgi:hypothetical protein